MNHEEAFCFECRGERLVGILNRPAEPREIGLVIVVGGPQYRVGSHRQFALLARHLEREGFAVLRFDCRGMGDSSGEFPGFEHISADIAAAVDALCARVPAVRGVALWGLCDAASAALLYPSTDQRVAGLALVNPWVRSEATLARTYLRHYYIERLLSRDFWRKLLSGGLRPGRVLGDLADNVRTGAGDGGAGGDYVARMRAGLAAFTRPVLVLLSGNDITAAEFSDLATTPAWKSLVERPGVTRRSIAAATHTFSSAEWREEAARLTAEWLGSLRSGAGSRAA
jgi:uncharacterized protein